MQHPIIRIIIILFPYYRAFFHAIRPPSEGFFNSPVLRSIKIHLEPHNHQCRYAPPMFGTETEWPSEAVPTLKLVEFG